MEKYTNYKILSNVLLHIPRLILDTPGMQNQRTLVDAQEDLPIGGKEYWRGSDACLGYEFL